MGNKTILLIGFYNKKALGVRFLERSLAKAGYNVYVLFIKDFNSVSPEEVTNTELVLMKELIASLSPAFIGLSVMSTLYYESVITVNNFIRRNFTIPIVWGGVFASLFPEISLEHADYALRGEGEEAIVELADALINGKPYREIKNLVYTDCGSIVINDLRPLCRDLDELGYPLYNPANKFFIDRNSILHDDPMTNSVSYELSASRGCPFACSYCSSVNLKRLYRGNGRYIRFRSVPSIISELTEAVSNMKNLKVIHFWDEIFPDDKVWVDSFADQYKAQIRLPFEIWGHPLKANDYVISRLVDAGLYKVVMGIQSGSASIRKEIFHRSETQEDILNASRVLSSRKVPQVIYDFILRHPFENEAGIRSTYELCTRLSRPFELQLHGLNFLPGTDIIKIAERKGAVGKDELEAGLKGSLREKYKTYWGQENKSIMMNYWYSLIYISQFRTGMLISKQLCGARKTKLNIRLALILPGLYYPAAKLRYVRKKSLLLIRAFTARIGLVRSGKHAVQYSEGN